MFVSFASPVHAFVVSPFPDNSTFGTIIGAIGVTVATYYVVEGVKLVRQRVLQEGWIISTAEAYARYNVGETITIPANSILYFNPSQGSTTVSYLNTAIEGDVLEKMVNNDGQWCKVRVKR